MTHYLLPLAWTFALTASFAGWGGVVGRVLLGRGELEGGGDLGERIAWGIALTVALGGLANLARLISPAALVGHAVVGLALFMIDLGRRRASRPDLERPPGWVGRALIVAIVVLTLVRLGDAAHVASLEGLDDHTAYLVFPAEMLQTGGMTRDPFCTRRIESALGGMSILTAFATAVLPVEDAKTIDLGVGLLAVLAATLGLARSRRLLAWAWILPVALVLLDRPPSSNLTALLIPTALLFATHRALGLDDRLLGRAALLGLLAATLVSLKSSLIPITFFVFLLDGLPRIARRATWRALPVELLAGLVCLAPWMIALKQSSGTYLYPILGKGVHGSRYGTFLSPNADFTAATLRRAAYVALTDPQVVAYLVLATAATAGWLQARARRDGDESRPEDLALVLAPVPSLAVMIALFDRALAIRYAAPILPASMVVGLMMILRRSADPRREARNALVGLACFAFFAGARWPETRALYQFAALNVRDGLSGRPYVPPAVRASYTAMQGSVPPGERLLTHLSLPFLLDFRRNPISVADWPGGASPPPGLPSFQGAEPLANYLRDQGIRYVAYSYADQMHIPRDVDWSRESTWVRTVFRHAHDFQDALASLMTTRRRAFDDGSLVVIDLATMVK